MCVPRASYFCFCRCLLRCAFRSLLLQVTLHLLYSYNLTFISSHTALSRYAVGGDGDDWLSSVEFYQPATDNWVAVASMRTARGAPGVAVLGGLLYAVGGCVLFASHVRVLTAVRACEPSDLVLHAHSQCRDPCIHSTIVFPFSIPPHIPRSCIARYGSGESGHPSALWLTSAEAYSPARDAWTAIASLTGGKYDGLCYKLSNSTWQRHATFGC